MNLSLNKEELSLIEAAFDAAQSHPYWANDADELQSINELMIKLGLKPYS